jgi:MEMO1 family protein
MKGVKLQFPLAFFIMMMTVSCQSQNNKPAMDALSSGTTNRTAAVAGQFYPPDPQELKNQLKKYFSKTQPKQLKGDVMAIIAPHAGYVYSGEVAAAAYCQLDPDKTYQTIFVIGLSHHDSFAGGSIYTIGNYETPLGEVAVNLSLAGKLALENTVLDFDPSYQRYEHSLEVQMPFIQYHFNNPQKIVPILLGTTDPKICRKITNALSPYFNPDYLFVISTDFSHYPAYDDAKKVDKSIADAIETNTPETLLRAVEDCRYMHINNLATGICSWPGVYTLLEITHNKPGIHITPLKYQNSGDSDFGDHSRVVGYYALVVTQENNDTSDECSGLDEKDKDQLLAIARNTIANYLKTGNIPDIKSESLSKGLQQKRGVFVSLHKHGDLRGCLGHFEADKPLWSIVQEMAVSSATQDYRFSPVISQELAQIHIEISVLSPLRRIKSEKEIILGKHGIYIRNGSNSGTFLPQVATATKWTKEEFLGHCAQDKAGIGWDGWKDAELFVYEACVFGEKSSK